MRGAEARGGGALRSEVGCPKKQRFAVGTARELYRGPDRMSCLGHTFSTGQVCVHRQPKRGRMTSSPGQTQHPHDLEDPAKPGLTSTPQLSRVLRTVQRRIQSQSVLVSSLGTCLELFIKLYALKYCVDYPGMHPLLTLSLLSTGPSLHIRHAHNHCFPRHQ